MNKKIKVFIICSVILNVLFIGLFGGLALKHMGVHFSQNQPVLAILKQTRIPEARRTFMESKINTIIETSHRSHAEIEKMREETFKILTAETFDEVAYQEQIDKMFNVRNEQRKNMSEAIKTLAKQLNSEERLALAEILRDISKKH